MSVHKKQGMIIRLGFLNMGSLISAIATYKFNLLIAGKYIKYKTKTFCLVI